MAKAHGLLADWLSGTGNRIFRFLSKCEESVPFSKTARFVKVSLLGLMVALIAACAKKGKPDGERGPVTSCYAVGRMDPVISEVSATPNPTRGAWTIRIKATAKVLEPTLENNYISDAWLQIGGDTSRLRMYPVDGRFSDTLEMLEGRINVAGVTGVEPGTTFVYVHAATSKGEQSLISLPLVISKKESR